MLKTVIARRAFLSAACAAVALTVACNHDLDAPFTRAPRAPVRRVAGVVAITFRNIGKPNMTSSAIVGSSVAEVVARRTAQTGLDGARLNLTVPRNQDGSGDQTIQLRPVTGGVGATNTNGTRYFHATYAVRNAQKTDSTAFDTPRVNLTFVAFASLEGPLGPTIADSPVLEFTNDLGDPVTPALTHELKPSGLVEANGAGGVIPISPDVLQVFTQDELTAFRAGATAVGVANIFPYGFVVHHKGDDATRTLPASPPEDEFDGEVTFAFRFPLQSNAADNPTTVTVLMLALDDSEVRVTQSLEEQSPAGTAAFRARALSLNATGVRLLPGASAFSVGSATTEFVCSVRTAGPEGGPPRATLVNTPPFLSLEPSAFSPAGTNTIATDSRLTLKLNGNVSGAAGPSTFVVRGLISGRQFRGKTYSGSGTATVSTPAGAFQPFEEVEVTLTSSLACPPWVGRLRVGRPNVSAGATGNLGNLQNPTGPTSPRTIAVGDFNEDGNLDLAIAGFTGTVAIQRGDGAGHFTTANNVPGAGSGLTGIVVADFDGDGHLDLATVGSTVTVFFGNGAGAFGNQKTLTAGSAPIAIAVGDFNGDGLPDLVVTTQTSQSISIFLNNGDRTFQPPRTTQNVGLVFGNPTAIGDVNRDGNLDLVVATRAAGGSISVLFGRGDGTFNRGPSTSLGSPFEIGRAHV